MRALTVYYNHRQVGRLVQDDHGLMIFNYFDSWLNDLEAFPLSRMLPLIKEGFKGKQARAFFAGILPEQDIRRKVASILGVSERNDFALLEGIGGECAGAVSLFPEGNDMLPSVTTNRSRFLHEDELAAIVEELPRRPLMAGKEGVRLSLAGAQDKLPVLYRQDGISLPLGSTPSTHIFKPEPERFPGLVANEAFCMTLAGKAGLPVPEVFVLSVRGHLCLVVSRYDRKLEEGRVLRLHQEDFCQATGFPPEQKYQEEGGPSLPESVKVLREWSSVPVLDLLAFVDALIFNVLIGNADAHAKNFSFLYGSNGQKRLAPFYDLVCTLAWDELSKNLAMRIGECRQINNLTLDHWKQMAKSCNLGWAMVRERLVTVARKVKTVLPDAAKSVADMGVELPDTVIQIISDRVRELLEDLK